MSGNVILYICAIACGILLVMVIVRFVKKPTIRNHSDASTDNSSDRNGVIERIDTLIAKSSEDSIVRKLLIARKNYLLQASNVSASPFDISQIVTEKEEQVFLEFSKSFKQKIDTQNIWIISNAHRLSVIKSKAKLSWGSLNYIQYSHPVPIISTAASSVAFFPCFIVYSLGDGQIILKQWREFESSTNDIEIREFEKDLEGGVAFNLVRKEINPNHKKRWDGSYTAPMYYCVIKYAYVDLNTNDEVIAFANKQYATDLYGALQKAQLQLKSKFQYISEDYYSEILSHERNLHYYIHSICTTNLIQYINAQKLKYIADEQLPCDTLLEQLTISDVYTTLENLKGGNISLREREGVCAMLLGRKWDAEMKFEDYISMTDDEISSIETYVESVVHSFHRDEKVLSLTASLLENYDADMALQFLIYLYRLLSTTIKTDTVIWQEEQTTQQIYDYAKRIDKDVDMTKDVVDTYEVRKEFGDKFLVGKYIVHEQKCVISDIHAGLEISRDRILIALKALEAAGVVQTNGSKRVVLIKNENDVIRLLRGQSAQRLN